MVVAISRTVAPPTMRLRRTSLTAPQVLHKEFLFSQSNNDRQLLNMVDGASPHAEGSFGECVSCGKRSMQALEAVPGPATASNARKKREGLLKPRRNAWDVVGTSNGDLRKSLIS